MLGTVILGPMEVSTALKTVILCFISTAMTTVILCYMEDPSVLDTVVLGPIKNSPVKGTALQCTMEDPPVSGTIIINSMGNHQCRELPSSAIGRLFFVVNRHLVSYGGLFCVWDCQPKYYARLTIDGNNHTLYWCNSPVYGTVILGR